MTTPDMVDRRDRALIVKAALEANAIEFGPDHGRPLSRPMIEAEARLDAFGQVAADVLHLCAAPAVFVLAVREAVRLVGVMPVPFAASREVTARIRKTWLDGVVVEVAHALGLVV